MVRIGCAIVKAVAGTSAAVRFQRALLACMPDGLAPHDPEVSLQRVAALKATDTYRLAPRGVQGELKHVSRLLGQLVDERPCDVRAAMASRKIRPVVESFQFFVEMDTGGGVMASGRTRWSWFTWIARRSRRR